ncbi:transmembrane protein 215 [Lampetra fluviatilis]
MHFLSSAVLVEADQRMHADNINARTGVTVGVLSVFLVFGFMFTVSGFRGESLGGVPLMALGPSIFLPSLGIITFTVWTRGCSNCPVSVFKKSDRGTIRYAEHRSSVASEAEERQYSQGKSSSHDGPYVATGIGAGSPAASQTPPHPPTARRNSAPCTVDIDWSSVEQQGSQGTTALAVIYRPVARCGPASRRLARVLPCDVCAHCAALVSGGVSLGAQPSFTCAVVIERSTLVSFPSRRGSSPGGCEAPASRCHPGGTASVTTEVWNRLPSCFYFDS